MPPTQAALIEALLAPADFVFFFVLPTNIEMALHPLPRGSGHPQKVEGPWA